MTQSLLSSSVAPGDRAVLVGVTRAGESERLTADYLDELAELIETAGGEAVDREAFRRETPEAGTFIGRGQAERLAARVASNNANVALFDDDLSPAQGRNLEALLGVKVLDRTQLILDIFAMHARSREGALQIEWAQLQYLLPRLRRMWSHLERQRGGIGHMTGAGEQQIEIDRRRIEERMTRIRKELEGVRARRAEQRRGRRRHGWALIALVGYTNAGKSTLLNALTGADALADDKLFATLDPTTRQLRLPNNQSALITDTVGFIRKLPHGLVESFKATLEEVAEADLLLHVIDVAHPRMEEHRRAVEDVLHELGAASKPVILVFNKIDTLPRGDAPAYLLNTPARAVALSAREGSGLYALLDELADALQHRNETLLLRIPLAEGQALAELKRVANVHRIRYDAEHALVEAGVPKRHAARWRAFIADRSAFKEDDDAEEQGEPTRG